MLRKTRELIGENTLFLFNTHIQDPNFVYLADIAPGFENNALILTSSQFTHLTSEMEYQRAKKSSLAKPKVSESVFAYLQKNHTGKILVNGRFLPYLAYKRITKFAKVEDISNELSNLRMIKAKDEISRIRKAKKIALESFKQAKLTGTEIEIRRKLESKYEPAYPAIVAADSNSSCPHHFSGNKTAKRILLMDFGAKYKNRVCDLTRTRLIKPTKEMKKVYEAVQQAQAAARDAALPGTEISEVSKASSNIIKKAGYEKNILHALGHGLGVQVHEGPVISSKSQTVLEPGMVFTIEPGIYTKTFGVRLEDDFQITKNGCKLV